LGLRVVATLGAAALVSAGSAASSPHLTIAPSQALVDAPVDVRVTGLAPGTAASLQVTTQDYLGKTGRGRVAYTATAKGVIDTHGNGRIFSSITGPDGPYFGSPLGPANVKIAVLVRRRVVAQGLLVRRFAAEGVTKHVTTLATDGFVGVYFAPPDSSTAAPAVLVIGGSKGGYAPYNAILLASHGYPSLSLAYVKEPGLPQTLRNVPLEYFAKALRWLAAQPGVASRRVVILGASFGGEAALLIGSTYPGLVNGVIAASPSFQASGGLPSGAAWAFKGKPVFGTIPVEKIAGPVLAIAGGKDDVWNSADSVSRIVQRARAHGRTDVHGMVYPLAGHGVVGIPNLPAPGEVEIAPRTFLELGGTPTANAAAHTDSWSRILRFLRSFS
jgi:dienelactone hydrolase